MTYYNTTLKNLEYRLRKFKDLLPTYLETIIQKNEAEIIHLIADDQLYRRGVNGKDIKIKSYAPYAPSTIKRKHRLGQPTTRVTLRDTGEFHKSMFLVFEADGFYVTSDNYKTQYLVKKYGDEIFRLTDKNLTKFIRQHVRKELTKILKRELKNARK